MKKITSTTFLDFQFASTPSFSPDGNLAAYVVSTADEAENRYKGDLHLLDVATKTSRKLTSGGDARSYIWLKNGNLLFPAMRDKDMKSKVDSGESLTCYYEISPFGGEATLAFTIPLSAGMIEQLDEDRFALLATFDNNLADMSTMSENERKQTLEKLKNPSCEVLDEAPFWSNGEGFTSGKRTRLYIYTRSTDEIKDVTEPWFDAAGFSVFGDKMLYLGAEWRGIAKPFDGSGVYLYDLTEKTSRELIAPGKFRIGGAKLMGDKTALVFINDGLRHDGMQFDNFYTLPLDGGEIKLLCNYEASIGGGSVGTDAKLGGGRENKVHIGLFYFVTTIEESSYLRYVNLDGAISELLTPAGSCNGFDVSGGRILTCSMHGDGLSELYLDGEKVTDFSAVLADCSISTPIFHSFKSSDGFDIHGYAMKPAGYDPGKKYPAILHIHGGPQTVFGEVLHHEMQVWANDGYFVFFSNPRGSDGRGSEFCDIQGKYGTVDYVNLMEFADEMLRLYPDADAENFGVTGGSYGGFMTNWIIGHTDRFKCACSQRSISNWATFEHTSDIGTNFTPLHQGTTTREDADTLWWHSPLKYAHNCKTPTLFIHSDMDYRCWMAEGISMFTSLKIQGVDSRLVLFRNETHELSRSGKPENRIRRMDEILAWMNKYLKSE